MTYLDVLQKQLVIDEGERNKMYLDSKGIPTIGIGHNLRDKPISDRAVRVIFEDDMADAEEDARRLIPKFDELSEVRKAAVINLAFNLGTAGFAKFQATLGYINAGDFEAAADTFALNKRYYSQVGDRARRIEEAIRKG